MMFNPFDQINPIICGGVDKKKFPRCLPTTENWGQTKNLVPIYLHRKSSYKISAQLVEEWLSYDTFSGQPVM